jgi:hypothetical protein
MTPSKAQRDVLERMTGGAVIRTYSSGRVRLSLPGAASEGVRPATFAVLREQGWVAEAANTAAGSGMFRMHRWELTEAGRAALGQTPDPQTPSPADGAQEA